MWATDANGSIDIDVVNGSRLLIKQRDVENGIDNVGALSQTEALRSSETRLLLILSSPVVLATRLQELLTMLALHIKSLVTGVSVNAALATVIGNRTGDSDDQSFSACCHRIQQWCKTSLLPANLVRDYYKRQESPTFMPCFKINLPASERLEKIASGQLFLMNRDIK